MPCQSSFPLTIITPSASSPTSYTSINPNERHYKETFFSSPEIRKQHQRNLNEFLRNLDKLVKKKSLADFWHNIFSKQDRKKGLFTQQWDTEARPLIKN